MVGMLLVVLAVTWLAAPLLAQAEAAPKPLVTGVSPSSGLTSGGNTVTVSGKYFKVKSRNVVRTVTFSGTKATGVKVLSATRLTVKAPARDRGMTNVRVTTAYGMSKTSAKTRYTFQAPKPAPLPVVDSISPTYGPSAGGTVVTVTGADFGLVTGVTFGTTPAFFLPTTSTSLQAIAPPGTGTVPVLVTTPNGTSVASSSAQFAYAAAVITSVTASAPHTPAGGNDVTIKGTGFSDVTSVTFGSSPATITSWTDSEIHVLAPAGTGTVAVTVTTPAGTNPASPEAHYVYAPTVTAVDPAAGSPYGGTPVTISGTGFTAATAVHFGATAATSFSVTSDTEITAVAPAYTDQAVVDVKVTTAAGQSSAVSDARYSYAPCVAAVSPASGPVVGGTQVTLTGTGLSGATVRFGSETATVVSLSDTQVTVLSPAHAAGVVDVVATTSVGSSPVSEAARFRYAVAPTITGLGPDHGPSVGGNTVTITGTDFMEASAVKFGDAPAVSFSVTSPTTITAVAPAGSGVVLVSVTTPLGTSEASPVAEYIYTAPTVTGLSPDHGPAAGGTEVTITGSGFSGATAVKFGTAAATSFSVSSDTHITATAPEGVGTVTVTVTGPEGTSADNVDARFTYAPTISSISPDHGSAAGGSEVTLTGTGFLSATGVTFNGIAGTGLSASSDTSLVVTVPASSVGGPIEVVVETAKGSSAAATYTYGPVVDSITPTHGPQAGGDEVVISGTGFGGVTSVKFGDAAGTLTSWTPIEIRVTAPAGSGLVHLTVETAAGTSAPIDYTYDAP
jgi:hypothetical protein